MHVVGAGGSAMSAIATILQTLGHRVTGSDVASSTRLDRLSGLGVEVHVGHRPSAVADVDVVIVSTDVPPDDPEVDAARQAGVPVLRRADAMAAVCARAERTVAVAGAHGKTTTTAMLALALRATGVDPSFLVGGEVRGLDAGVWWGRPDWFVVEADESDGTFLRLGAHVAVVTSIEPDHLDHWGSFDALRDGFRQFLAEATGPRVVCIDDARVAAVAADIGGCTTYGTAAGADYRIEDLSSSREGVSFHLRWTDGEVDVTVPAPGAHNARNAAAVVATCAELGLDVAAAVRSLASFPGVSRRFEHRGDAAGITFVDSYDHLPTEVASVLAAARSGGWRRIVCVFQPHRYTRTAALWHDFADAFVDADVVAVTDIYSAGQAPIPGITGKLIVDAVLDAHPRTRLAWLPGREGLRRWLLTELRPGDLCLTLGAGDLTTLPDELLVTLTGGSRASA